MNNIIVYTPKYFKAYELVDPDTYKIFGEQSLFLLDPRLLYATDKFREYLNKPFIINNWYSGGSFRNRGFRTPNSTTGGYYSQHRHGRALDYDVSGMTSEEVRQLIIKGINNTKLSFLKYITCLEIDVNWVHMDCRAYDNSKGLLLVKP